MYLYTCIVNGYQLTAKPSLLTLVYLRIIHLYLFFSYGVLCSAIYIGPCGVRVPIGTVHSQKFVGLNVKVER